MSYRRVEKESDELINKLIVYGLVTRYGPRTNCQRKRLKKKNRNHKNTTRESPCR